MKKWFPILLLFALVFSSCDDDDQMEAMTADILVNFKATYDGQPLEMLKTYTYSGVPVQFLKFDFYVGNAVLTQKDNGSTIESELSEIEFVDLSFDSPQEAEQGVILTTRAVEADTYDGLSFGIGVPADLNAMSWDEFSGGHPLRNDTHYWEAWGSFIFAKIEGQLDMDGDGTFESSFTYHTGTDALYEGLNFNADFDLKPEEEKTMAFSVDVQKLFRISDAAYDADSDGYIDLQTHQGVHTDQQLILARSVMQNFPSAISLID